MTTAERADTLVPRERANRALTQIKSLQLLWETAQRDHGGSRVCVKLLLGLYNGRRFPFDLTELRCLDEEHLRAALAVIEMDSRPQMEVHELLNKLYGRIDIGHRFELLACDWDLKGRCTRDGEKAIRAALDPARFGAGERRTGATGEGALS